LNAPWEGGLSRITIATLIYSYSKRKVCPVHRAIGNDARVTQINTTMGPCLETPTIIHKNLGVYFTTLP
jgi:hypothetical protein